MRISRSLQRLFSLALILFSGPILAAPCQSSSRSIPDIKLQVIAKNIDKPTAITHAGDGSGRLFVLEQEGRIRVIINKKLQPRPFLDIRDQVASGGEKGLLGIAFHPQFKTNRLFYLNYTSKRPALSTTVAEYRVNKQGIVTANNERTLLTIDQPWSNHNGGQLAFGPDGYLYIAMGDGGSGDDPTNNGQSISTLLGSILRIDVNTRDAGLAYGIPRDNPFIQQKNARPEIWAWGLRNPWRFSFDRLTQELYAADVGQDEVEEINIIEKGKNYGWRIMEGPICTPGVNPDCQKAGLTLPIYSYQHDKGASITGGYVYRGKEFPELCGVYLYGDFVSQAIWGLRVKNGKVIKHKTLFSNKSLYRLAIDYFRDDGLLISTFGEDETGEVYVAAYQSGRIYKIVKK